eukprot:scaffold52039_cov65-Phaeocystis_antarctica.AAC.4
MTLTFVAFHLNLTAFALIGPPPPTCTSWGKRLGRSGCSEPQRDTAIFFTTRGGGRSMVELENKTTFFVIRLLHKRAHLYTPLHASQQRNSSLKDLFRRHTAALCSLCSRFLQPVSRRCVTYSRRQVLEFAAPARAEHKFSRQGQTIFQHPRNEPFFTPHQQCSHIGVGGQLNSAD